MSKHDRCTTVVRRFWGEHRWLHRIHWQQKTLDEQPFPTTNWNRLPLELVFWTPPPSQLKPILKVPFRCTRVMAGNGSLLALITLMREKWATVPCTIIKKRPLKWKTGILRPPVLQAFRFFCESNESTVYSANFPPPKQLFHQMWEIFVLILFEVV